MDRGVSVTEQRLAEKLSILNDRGLGMITRIYNIKKACSDAKARPGFLSDKSLDPAIKAIVKKFPVTDTKDNTSELLTEIDANFVHFDITLNYGLTKSYLDLIVTYATLMMLVARVEDRKAVLGLYNHAFEMKNGRGLRVSTALQSVHDIYLRRNITAEQWRQSQIISIISVPVQMLNPVTSDVPPVEYLSLETIQKWILFGYTLCHQQLAMPGVTDMWRTALQDGYCVTLYRDEIIMFHKEFQNLLDGMKGYSKRVKDIQDAATQAVTLRSNSQRASQLSSDSLEGDILVVLQALSMARDEVLWLIRHACTPPPKGKKLNQEDFVDFKLPQLLLFIEEIRGMMQKYVSVLQRYFIQYLGGFDVNLLKEVVQKISVCSDDISIIMTSFIDDLSQLNVKQVEAGDTFDFESMRLDWMRLQAYTSVRGTSPELKDNRDLAVLMNNVSFHSKLVDVPERLLMEVSDLSIFCFYPSFFEDAFLKSVEDPNYSSHFMSSTNEYCPEERYPIGERSLSAVNMFLDSMAKEARNILSQVGPEHIQLNQQKDKNKKNIQSEFVPPGSESFRKSRESLTALDRKLIALTEICRGITYTDAIPVWEHIFAPREYLNTHLEEFFTKSVITMVQFDADNLRIARPSELLGNVKAEARLYFLKLPGVDMARLFNHVLLQQTQPEDSQGAITITNMYSTWYLDVFLRRVATDNVVYSPRRRSFVNKPGQSFRAEEYTDVNELQALAELLGAYGMKHLGQKLLVQVGHQVGEIKKLVVQNKDLLSNLRSCFDKQDQCMEQIRRLKKKKPEDDSLIWSLFLVFAAVALPSLAYRDASDYNADLEVSILIMANSKYNVFFEKIVNESPYLTMDVLESCFPYALLRNAYHEVYQKKMEIWL
ncbi:Nck-associated protein 1-like protein [Acropora cervicornis]|uniref:Nck-associated protein 1-like protein n=1 Tax=Acropora cervicornis TaxID=6130 RepID=A0AAD9VBL5_ACRCE|nr:Nck-associated protein 1-like protein [Acropora cervicornis]